MMPRQAWEYCILDYREPEHGDDRSGDEPEALGTWVASSCLSHAAEEELLGDPANRYDVVLGRLGDDGWELVCTFQSRYAYAGDPVLIFKRPKLPAKPPVAGARRAGT